MAAPQLAHYKVPAIDNEPMKSYAPGSPERAALAAAIDEMKQQMPFEVPCIVNGKPVKTGATATQAIPHMHSSTLCTFHTADAALVKTAIDSALEAKKQWELMPWGDRAAIFLKAADLVSGKYRYKLLAATILGQGKNAWQAEIDAAAELADFLRFGVKYVEELYSIQPPKNSAGCWNRTEYRPLEGFVLAISPFNFTAIGGNLVGAPALVGNVCIWKPSPLSVYANYLVHRIFTEAGVPAGVIQFLPCTNEPSKVSSFVSAAISSPHFAALHFTGSTDVFKKLWKEVASNMDNYKGYPRLVGETGGKNFHLIHSSVLDIEDGVQNAVMQSVRSGFEYQGQKCSALSRIYVASSVWTGGFKDRLLSEVAKIKVGDPTQWDNFLGPVIAKHSFDKILSYIQKAKDAGGEILCGGSGDDSTGYYVQPTVILTKDPKSVTMVDEIFGPVVTIYVYDDDKYEETIKLVDETSKYGLTGSIFAADRAALLKGSTGLINAAGNVYYNEKCTGAVVGQQPFGGARWSGTNDKAGSMSIFSRFVSPRSVKEGFIALGGFDYPSNLL